LSGYVVIRQEKHEKVLAVIAAAGIALIGTSAHAATAHKATSPEYRICLSAEFGGCLNNLGTGNQNSLTYTGQSYFTITKFATGNYIFETLNGHCVYLNQAHAAVYENSNGCNANDAIDNWSIQTCKYSTTDCVISVKNLSFMHTAAAGNGPAVWSSNHIVPGDYTQWKFCPTSGTCIIFDRGEMVPVGRQARR
jgi:hypothetical protein